MSSPRTVTVTAGARLHFGLCALGPVWGGAGVTVAAPVTRVEVAATDGPAEFRAPPGEAGRLRAAVTAVTGDRPVRAELLTAPPAHVGLGSGTQIALAAATAAARLLGEPDPEAGPLFERLGRGHRSRLGAAGFRSGGLLLDAYGRLAAEQGVGVRSLPLPAAWRWVIVTPTAGGGVTGGDEAAALQGLPEFPRPFTNGLRRLITQGLPLAAGEGEAPASAALFARILGDYGTRVGRRFAGLQGGVFASPAVRLWARDRAARGLPAPVQSSWGPTACTLFAAAAMAEAEAEQVRRLLGEAATVTVTPTRNRGAAVQERAPR